MPDITIEPGKFYLNGRGDLLGPMRQIDGFALDPDIFVDQHDTWYHPNGRQANHAPGSTGNIVSLAASGNEGEVVNQVNGEMLGALRALVGILRDDLESHLGEKIGKQIRAAITHAEALPASTGRGLSEGWEIHYAADDDVLYITSPNNRPATGIEMAGDVLWRFADDNGELVGITLMNPPSNLLSALSGEK